LYKENWNEQNLPRVAYFCMEFGLHEKLPIYAGGLGVLAGDYLKAAKDLQLPVIGLGILWRQDYTEQYIDDHGNLYDVYPTYNYEFLHDTGVMVSVWIGGEEVKLKIWQTDQFDNAPLYLLDAGKPGMKNGKFTARLYGGGSEDRVIQEMILGIGGIRALRALNIDIDIYHFNEGHAVLAGLELIREKMEKRGVSFEEAWEMTRKEVVFTTHTPVEAGNEKHSHDLLFQLGANNTLSYEQLLALGGNPFNMTAAALRLSSINNGVSEIHGETARNMWRGVDNRGPIISVTNGVHVPTWQAPEIREAFEQGGDLWEAHMHQKRKLIDFVAEESGTNLNPDALLVGFARRAAAYKRSDLIFRNVSSISSLLEEGRLQLIFSGKAHPNDDRGKSIIKELVKMDRRFKNSVVFLENYNIKKARLIIRGCDIWLNNPYRPMEASGTSGMKAALNGVLNLSVLDGWVGEGVQHGICGWLLDAHPHPYGETHDIGEDERDLKALYHILINDIIPIYYNNRPRWLEMMKAAIKMSMEKFSSSRMAREYYELMYNYAMEQQFAKPGPH
jgi:starch phosphorylase